jgi:hypothetical protein
MKRKFILNLIFLFTIFSFNTAGIAGSNVISMDETVEVLRHAFNNDLGKLRVLMYVSPTCGGCLRGAKLTNNEVLAELPGVDLSVYVVWAPKNGAREKHVGRVLDLVTDERATQYWDEHGTIVDAYDTMYSIEGRPCAGVFMLYEPDAEWGADGPPKPAYYVDAHAREFQRTAGSQFDAQQLAEEARRILREST